MIAPLLIHTELEDHICIPVLHVFLGMVDYALNRLEDMCTQLDLSMYRAGIFDCVLASELISKRKSCVLISELEGTFCKRMQHVLFEELKIKKEPYHGGALAGHACLQVSIYKCIYCTCALLYCC